MILFFVFYGCETWSVTFREKHRLRVFENSVLRNIFESKRNDMTGLWINLQKQKFDDLYSSPNIIRVIKLRRLRWTGHVACMGDMRSAYVIVIGRPEGRKLLGRPRLRC
jgi:hypothetical protein